MTGTTEHNDRRIKVAILSLFIILTTILACFHEFWRDEWLAINLAVETESVVHLFSRLKYEGHPPLWFLIIRVSWALFESDLFIKIIHLFISWGIAYILLFKIRHDLFLKILILFSYFFLYEYTIVVRNYNLVLFFGVLQVYELKKTNVNPLWTLCYLIGMSLSHAYGVLVALCFSFYIFLQNKETIIKFAAQRKVIAIIVPAIALVATCLFLILPDSNHVVLDKERWSLIGIVKFAPKGFSAIWNSFVPVPGKFISFWNTNILDLPSSMIVDTTWGKKLLHLTNADHKVFHEKVGVVGYFLKFPFAFLILIAVYKRFHSERNLLISLVFGWFLIYIFQVYIYFGFLRHAGFYFILFLFFILLSEKKAGKFGIVVLLIHLVVSVFAFTNEIRYDFSSSITAVEFIKDNSQNQKKAVVVMDAYCYVPSISGYLGHGVEVAGYGGEQTYVLWEKFIREIPMEKSIALLKNKLTLGTANEGFLVFVDSPDFEKVKAELGKGYEIHQHEFLGSISGEDFFVVTVKKF